MNIRIRQMASILALATVTSSATTLLAQESPAMSVQTVQTGQTVSGGTVGGGLGVNVNSMSESNAQVRPADEPPPTVTTTPTSAVRGSLFRQAAMAPVPIGADGNPIGSPPVNFIAVDAPRPKKYKKNDVLTIIVQEDSDYTSNAQNKSEKQQDFDIALQNMVQAKLQNGFPALAAVTNPGALPEVKFKYDNNRNNQASQLRSDSFSVRISATVVDVKPNGTVVVEAVKQIKIDKEVQTFRLSGICRAEDVTPDNTVLSTQLANLTVSKQTTGELRDGTKRGWLNSLIDKFGPF